MKYRNVKTVIDGITFDSKKEAARYAELKILLKGKVISNLELQPSFPVVVNDKKICVYKADFSYTENGKSAIEDVKGVRTPVYRLKKKLVEALYGIKIIEI